MFIWYYITEILAVFAITGYTGKVSFFNLSPVMSVNNTTILNEIKYEKNEEIPITIEGEIADLIEDKEIIGNGEIYNNFTLIDDKKYIFSKVDEKICKDVPFYYDEDTGLDFYYDECHTSVYTCDDDKTFISTDVTNYIENEPEQVKIACSQIIGNRTSLQKRAKCEDIAAVFNASVSIVTGGLGLLITTNAVGFAVIVAGTAISMIAQYSCVADSVSEDVCCKKLVSCSPGPNGGYCYTDYDCTTLW